MTTLTTTIKAKELFYFSLSSTDLEKSKSFYSKVFGWEMGGGSLGGHVNNSNNTPCGVSGTTNAVYFGVEDDLEAAMSLVKSKGGKVVSQHVFDSVGPAALCQDDQGTKFYLQAPGTPEMKDHMANKVQKGSQHGDLFFFSLPVQDEDKARDFFGTVLGWAFATTKGEQGGLGVQNLRGPDGGLGCGRDGHDPSIWIRVDDVQKASELVVEAGGTTGEIFEAPEGTMCQCIDDQGVKFGIVKPAPEYL